MFNKDIQILVVDDMKTMRKIVMKSLTELGFSKYLEAEDGAKAWSIVNEKSDSIQLIISDWNMPNSNGLDLLKRVRADKRFKQLPFILLTAEAESSQVQDAVKAGVDGYIIKPFTVDILKQRLEQVYTKKAA